MNAPKLHPTYIITISIGDISRTQLWDASKPKALGHTIPWSAVHTPQGIRLRHRSGRFCEIKPEIIEKELQVKVPELESGPGKFPVLLKIKRADEIPPVYQTHPIVDGSGEWEVYECLGPWIRDAVKLGKKYSAVVRRKTAFTVTPKFGDFVVRVLDPVVEVSGDGVPSELGDRRTMTLRASQLASATLRHGMRVWRFRQVDPKAAAFADRPVFHTLDPEQRWFRRSFAAATLLFFLLLLIGTIFEGVKEDDKDKEEAQFAKIIFKRPPPSEGPSAISPEPPAPAPKAPVVVAPPAQAPVTTPPPAVQPKPQATASAAPKAPPAAVPTKPATAPAPKVSAAVLQAQKLQNSMKGLMGMTSLLAKSNVAPAPTGAAAGQMLAAKPGDRVGSAGSVPKASALGSQNVAVGYADGGGSADGSVSYSGSLHGKAQGKAGGGFVSMAEGDGMPTVSDDGLRREDIARVINEHISEIRYCYESAILRKPNLEGKIVVGFTISKSGSVKSTSVKDSSIQEPGLDKCLLSRLATWKFPQPKGNIDVSVVYPFVFRRL